MANSNKSGFHKRRNRPKPPELTVTISSDMLPDGVYGTVLTIGETVRWMDRADVLAHCAATMQVAVRAQHDAAIVKQLTFRESSDGQGLNGVQDLLRQARVDETGQGAGEDAQGSLGELHLGDDDLRAVGEVLGLVRARRAAVDWQALHPLRLEPSVTLAGKPFIAVYVNGERIGQWTPGEARRHALGCLEVVEAVELDNHYRDVLTDDIGCGENASAMVALLAREMAFYTVVEA